jgi:UPF0755 protein
MRGRRLLIGVIGAALMGLGIWRVMSYAPALQERSIIVNVPPQQSALQIAETLHDAGIIRSRVAFVALSLVRGTLGSLKAGEYEVPRRASTRAVLALLEDGRVRPAPLVHPEGATIAELAQALERAGLVDATEVMKTASDPSFLWLQGIEAPSAEGYVWPDTYQFVRGMSAAEILGRMVQRMHLKLNPDLRERARARRVTIHELLTLASIVEREAVARDEQPLISAVFWNRLRIGMPLQADPTVQYAVGRPRQLLSRSDLMVGHPYNTYTRTGLPPGPIASPGLAAIEATIEPASVDYLYFVKQTERRHRFSRTLQEHNEAIADYRASTSRPWRLRPPPRSPSVGAPADR